MLRQDAIKEAQNNICRAALLIREYATTFGDRGLADAVDAFADSVASPQ